MRASLAPFRMLNVLESSFEAGAVRVFLSGRGVVFRVESSEEVENAARGRRGSSEPRSARCAPRNERGSPVVGLEEAQPHQRRLQVAPPRR